MHAARMIKRTGAACLYILIVICVYVCVIPYYKSGMRTQFVTWVHTRNERLSHHPELQLVVGRTQHRWHLDSVGVNLCGILPPAAKTHIHANISKG